MGFRIDGLYTLRCYRAGCIDGWTFLFCFSQCLSHHLTDDLNFTKVCYLCWKKKNEIQCPRYMVRKEPWLFRWLLFRLFKQFILLVANLWPSKKFLVVLSYETFLETRLKAIWRSALLLLCVILLLLNLIRGTFLIKLQGKCFWLILFSKSSFLLFDVFYFIIKQNSSLFI